MPFPRSPTVSLFRCCRRAIATIPRMLKIVGQLLIVVVALAASADTTMQTETVVGRPARLARNNPYGSCRHYQHDHQCSNDTSSSNGTTSSICCPGSYGTYNRHQFLTPCHLILEVGTGFSHSKVYSRNCKGHAWLLRNDMTHRQTDCSPRPPCKTLFVVCK